MPADTARYRPLDDFIAPARARPELWRTLAGLAIAVAFYVVVLQLMLRGTLMILGPVRGPFAVDAMVRGTTPAGLVQVLFAYLPLTAGLGLGLALMLNRGLGSLIGPPAAALRSFLWVALPLLALWLALLPLSAAAPNVGRHLSFAALLPWLPLALVGLLIQSGTEELVFRGYLQQQLAARFRSPWLWMLVPALAFGALHMMPDGGGGLMVLRAVVFGLAAADLTARTGNLGAAVALHFSNNVATLLLVGLYGRLDGLALYTTVLDPADAAGQLVYVALVSLSVLVSWLSARLILRV